MDITELLLALNAASSETEKEEIAAKAEALFATLPDSEKEQVKALFLEAFSRKEEEVKAIIEEVDVYAAMNEISKYVSLSQIAKEYFGKSKEWLYQRIKGYHVNGKPAQFTLTERQKLSEALSDISRIASQTSLRIS